MQNYSISEAIMYLQKVYGNENMPTSEETLRRAVRTKDLKVFEAYDPGKKGYTISEADLIDYAERRMSKVKARKNFSSNLFDIDAKESITIDAIPFPMVYNKYISGELLPEQYYMTLFNEKMKWEEKIKKNQEELVKIEYERQNLKNEIMSCQSAIDAYDDGIKKYIPK